MLAYEATIAQVIFFRICGPIHVERNQRMARPAPPVGLYSLRSPSPAGGQRNFGLSVTIPSR